MFDLTDKTALITGASGGIGQAIAIAMDKCGAKTILTGRREDALKQVAAKLKNSPEIIISDLSNKEEAESLVQKAEDLAGAVDIVVANAGITKDNLALRMKDEEWDDVINTNLTSTFLINRAAFKKMMKRKWGRVINIASVVGVTGNPGQANYVASKAGMIGMTKSLALEAASRGITLNCIAPGFIKTDMTDQLNENQQKAITSKIPSGTFGLPDDIASAAVFLASNEAGYITGQTIHVNGGMVMI